MRLGGHLPLLDLSAEDRFEVLRQVKTRHPLDAADFELDLSVLVDDDLDLLHFHDGPTRSIDNRDNRHRDRVHARRRRTRRIRPLSSTSSAATAKPCASSFARAAW